MSAISRSGGIGREERHFLNSLSLRSRNGVRTLPFVKKNDFALRLEDLPAWDCHSHLDELPRISSQTFWDIAEYHWLHQELKAAGYPDGAAKLPENERIDAFLSAFRATSNTTWNAVFRRILADLYGIEISDETSVHEADRRIRASAKESGWPLEVCRRAGVRRITADVKPAPDLEALPGVRYRLPLYETGIEEKARTIAASADPHAIALRFAEAYARDMDALAAAGGHSVRLEPAPLASAAEASDAPPRPTGPDGGPAVRSWLAHAILRACERHALHVQLFVGIEREGDRAWPVYDPRLAASMLPLFQAHPRCSFEIVNGSSAGNLDIVQAAGLCRNVVPGPLWWFNFRESSLREAMRYRLEALPPLRCTLVASDAYVIEWMYGKVTLIRRVLSEFLWERIGAGWLDADDALRVARGWLHDAATGLCGA